MTDFFWFSGIERERERRSEGAKEGGRGRGRRGGRREYRAPRSLVKPFEHCSLNEALYKP